MPRTIVTASPISREINNILRNNASRSIHNIIITLSYIFFYRYIRILVSACLRTIRSDGIIFNNRNGEEITLETNFDQYSEVRNVNYIN